MAFKISHCGAWGTGRNPEQSVFLFHTGEGKWSDLSLFVVLCSRFSVCVVISIFCACNLCWGHETPVWLQKCYLNQLWPVLHALPKLEFPLHLSFYKLELTGSGLVLLGNVSQAPGCLFLSVEQSRHIECFGFPLPFCLYVEEYSTHRKPHMFTKPSFISLCVRSQSILYHHTENKILPKFWRKGNCLPQRKHWLVSQGSQARLSVTNKSHEFGWVI